MRIKKVIQFLVVASCFLVGMVVSTTAYAEEENGGEVGYDIQAVIPDNQIDKGNSYFDLRMKPEQVQQVSFMLNNTSDTDADFVVKVNQAYTNKQGFIDYSEAKEADKNSYPYAIKDIAKVAETVKVEKNSSMEVPITLTMPKAQFDGQILAAVQVTKKTAANSKGITNSYGYVLGLKLTETDTALKRDLKLKEVKAAESFGKTSVVATLTNPTMDAYGHLKYEATVKNLGTGKNVREVNYDNNMQMAPNSEYGFAIDWNNKRLEAGEYNLHLKVSDAKNNVWVFDKKFTITAKLANTINEATIDAAKAHDKLPIWVFIVIGILIAIIILGIIWFVLGKRKKKEQKEEQN